MLIPVDTSRTRRASKWWPGGNGSAKLVAVTTAAIVNLCMVDFGQIMTKDSSKGGVWPVSGLKQPFAPASSGKIAPVIFDYDPWTEDYGEPNEMIFDTEKSERSATEGFHHENGLREIGVDSSGRARFALGNCVHLETRVRRSVAGLGNRVSWLLREAAAAKTYGLNYAYGGVNIFPGTDLESAACVARPSQDFDTTIRHFDLPDRPSEATG